MDLDQSPNFVATSPIFDCVKQPLDTHEDMMKWIFKAPQSQSLR